MPHDRSFGSEEIPFRFAYSCNIGVHKFSLLPPGKPDVYAFLIGIGNVMPYPFVTGADNTFHRVRNQAHYPIKIMGAPIIACAATNGLMRMPIATGVTEPSDKSL